MHVVIELFRAFGFFFLNPILYITIVVTVILGYLRVKRERRYFHIRILNGRTELHDLVRFPLIYSLILSIFSVVVGLVLPSSLFIISVFVIIISYATFVFHLLSPIITLTISYSVLIIMHYFELTFELWGFTIEGIAFTSEASVIVAILAGFLLMVESDLICEKGVKYASPIRRKTPRGMEIISYLTKNITLLPIVFVIPGDAIPAYIPWWPQFTLGETQFSLIAFPIVIGFQQMTKRTLPVYFYAMYSKRVAILGVVTIVGGAIAFFEPIIGIVTLCVATIIRLALIIYNYLNEKTDAYAVTPTKKGVMIAAVLPNSPAEKMGLVVGEIIQKVNGESIFTEEELYQALQINAAHCRLEVLDHRQEIRLTQYVVHQNDHYQIGLLIAK